MVVNTLKMCTGDAGPEQNLVLLKINVDISTAIYQNIF